MARTKIQKTYNLLIQVTILVLTYYFIYDKVFRDTDLQKVFLAVKENLHSAEFLNMAVLILGMMAANWAIEAFKWKYMIGKIEKIGFFRSFYAVLAGVAVSSFTPNRIGEYFGRVFVLEKASRVEGTLITILGSMSQLLVTLLTGSAALLVFIPSWPLVAGWLQGYLYYILTGALILLNLMALGLFLNVSFLSNLKEKMLRTRFQKIRRFFRVFAFYHSRELMLVLGMSVLRYLVFASQFYLLLKLFSVPVSYPDALMVISVIYLVMAVIPTILITELGIRGSVSIYFFGILMTGFPEGASLLNFGVFAASTLLWLINVGMPAILGSFFVFRLHFFRKPEAGRS